MPLSQPSFHPCLSVFTRGKYPAEKWDIVAPAAGGLLGDADYSSVDGDLARGQQGDRFGERLALLDKHARRHVVWTVGIVNRYAFLQDYRARIVLVIHEMDCVAADFASVRGLGTLNLDPCWIGHVKFASVLDWAR